MYRAELPVKKNTLMTFIMKVNMLISGLSRAVSELIDAEVGSTFWLCLKHAVMEAEGGRGLSVTSYRQVETWTLRLLGPKRQRPIWDQCTLLVCNGGE